MLKKGYLVLTVFLLLFCSIGIFAADNNDDWLSVKKNIIIDSQGKPVRLTGINWFGFNCNERVFHGLWCMNLDRTLKEVVADRGFNILRIPMSTMLIDEWMNNYYKYIYVNQSENPHLQGMNSLEIFDYILMKCKELGIKIMIDIHHADDNNSGHLYPVWYKGDITPEIFYATLEWMAERYANDDTIIAYDLENEPHGNPAREQLFAKWDNGTDINNWKHAAARILAKNPNVLILVEGIEVFPKDGVNWDSINYDYKDIKIRYYFTSQDINNQAFNCWHAVIGAQNVIGNFGSENGNDYLEVSFKEGLPSLISNDENGSGEIQLAIHDVNCQENYDQTDDYSFNPDFSDYVQYDKITVYYKGKLVWGIEP